MIFGGGKSCTLLTFPCIKVHFYLRLIDCIRSLTIQKEQAFTEFSFVSISNNFSEFIYISTFSPLLDYFSFSSSKFAFLQPEWVLTWGVFLTNFTRGSEFSQVTSWRTLPFRFLWGRKGKYRKTIGKRKAEGWKRQIRKRKTRDIFSSCLFGETVPCLFKTLTLAGGETKKREGGDKSEGERRKKEREGHILEEKWRRKGNTNQKREREKGKDVL